MSIIIFYDFIFIFDDYCCEKRENIYLKWLLLYWGKNGEKHQLFNGLIFILGFCCKDTVKKEQKFKAENETYQKNFQKITAFKIHNKI